MRLSKAHAFLPEALSFTLAIVAGIRVGGTSWGRGFPLDDAWIHMVYGRSLATEGGFHYNTGIPGTGATSPLWALLEGVLHLLLGDGGPNRSVALGVKACGLLLHACSSVLAARLVRGAAPANVREIAAVFGGAAVAACPALAFAATSGMEVPLTTMLLLGALVAAAEKRSAAAGALAGLAACARPEAAIVIPLALTLAFRGARSRRAVTIAVVSAFAAPGIWAIRNLAVSGRPLPATVYAKSAVALGEDETFGHALVKVFAEMLPLNRPLGFGLGLFLAFAAIVLGARAVFRRGADEAMVMGAASLTAFAYVGGLCWHTRFIAPTSFYFQRYLYPVFPLFLVSAVWVLALLAAKRAVMSAVGTLVLVWEVVGWSEQREAFEGAVAQVESVQVAAGRYLAESLAPDAVVWSADAGAIRYFGRKRTVDLEGLNTPELVRKVEVPAEWNPDVILLQIPYGYRAWVDRVDPPVVLELPAGWTGMPTQAIVRCPSSKPGRVLVAKGHALMAKGHCRGTPP